MSKFFATIHSFFKFYFDSFWAALKTSWAWVTGIATVVSVLVALLLDSTKPEPQMEALMKTLIWVVPVITFVVVFFVVILLYVPYMKYKELKKEAEQREADLNVRIQKMAEELQRAKDQSDSEKTYLQAQLDVERARNAAPEIRGDIQEILVNNKYKVEGNDVGVCITINANIVNDRVVPTKIKSFGLRLKVKGEVYQSGRFYSGNLFKVNASQQIALKNLATSLNLPNGLTQNIGEDGYISFFVKGLYPPQPKKHIEGLVDRYPEDMVFSLEDIEDVTLIVADYVTTYEFEAIGVKPQWANVAYERVLSWG